MALKPSDLLIEAQKLIADKRHWTQGVDHGKTAHGDCYCARGALIEVANSHKLWTVGDPTLIKARAILVNAIPTDWPFSRTITNYNDRSTHKDVMLWFRRAIRYAKSTEKSL